MLTRKNKSFIRRSMISWLKKIGYTTIDKSSLLTLESREIISGRSFEKYRNVFNKSVKPTILALRNDDVMCIVCLQNLNQKRNGESQFFNVIGRIMLCNFYFTGRTFLAIPEWCRDLEFLRGLFKELDVGLITVDTRGDVRVLLKPPSFCARLAQRNGSLRSP